MRHYNVSLSTSQEMCEILDMEKDELLAAWDSWLCTWGPAVQCKPAHELHAKGEAGTAANEVPQLAAEVSEVARGSECVSSPHLQPMLLAFLVNPFQFANATLCHTEFPDRPLTKRIRVVWMSCKVSSACRQGRLPKGAEAGACGLDFTCATMATTSEGKCDLEPCCLLSDSLSVGGSHHLEIGIT